MSINGGVSNLADYIESTDDLRYAIVELALACWQDSDESQETLTALIGAVEAAKLTLFMHLGDKFND